MENVNTFIDKYLKKLDIPYWPDAIRAENINVSSTNKLEWSQTVAKIKKFTNLDAIIGFDIMPDPKSRTRKHIYLGVMQIASLL